MAYTRIKLEKNGSDVENARSKFHMALQNAMEKKNESPSSSDDDFNKESAEVLVKKEQSPVSTGKRQPQRTQRKRRRKDDSATRSSNTFVMKLFDRAVDLSPFSEETPLYPICRAWINNQPHQKSDPEVATPMKEEPPSTSDIDSDLEKITEDPRTSEVHHLPPARLREKYQEPKDMRIPSPIPQPEEQFVICSDEPGAPSKEILMAKHMERWRAVRQKWKQAAQANEDRYRDSGAVLKDIYERSQCRDSASNPDPWDIATPVT